MIEYSESTHHVLLVLACVHTTRGVLIDSSAMFQVIQELPFIFVVVGYIIKHG